MVFRFSTLCLNWSRHPGHVTSYMLSNAKHTCTHYHKKSIVVYIIDQVQGQDRWILAKFSFCVFYERDKVEVHKNAKSKQGQYPAILSEPAWSIKNLLYGIKDNEKLIFILVYF